MPLLQINPDSINITVETAYLQQHSQPYNKRFVFSYTVTIKNMSDQAAQLISRHWIITDANNAIQEVQGIGVIGQQPRILPGESYSYSSGSVLETSAGTMEGSYQMQTDSGENFDVTIPTFLLKNQQALH
jgi:ApaG protein